MRLILRDGREESVRNYAIEGERVRLVRAEGAPVEVALGEVDLERTFRAWAGLELQAPAAPVPGEAVLELVARSEQSHGGYLVLEGLLKNVSAAELRNVVANVRGEDADGGFVTCEEALVDWSPLRPGAESPFRVVLKTGGKVVKTRLQFRALLGEELPARGV